MLFKLNNGNPQTIAKEDISIGELCFMLEYFKGSESPYSRDSSDNTYAKISIVKKDSSKYMVHLATLGEIRTYGSYISIDALMSQILDGANELLQGLMAIPGISIPNSKPSSTKKEYPDYEDRYHVLLEF